MNRTGRRDSVKVIFLVSMLFSIFASLHFIIVLSGSLEDRIGEHETPPIIRQDNEASLHPDTVQSRKGGTRSTVSIHTVSSVQAIKPTTERSPKVLLFLGIFTLLDVPAERQRRHLIRHTYLDFDRVHNSTAPHRSCSLHQFLAENNEEIQVDHPCQVVYTFVCPVGHYLSNTTVYDTNVANKKSSLLVDSSLFPDYSHETDLLFMDSDPTTMGNQYRVDMIFQWYQYTHEILSEMPKHQRQIYDMEYVAFTDTEVVLFPSQFWANSILQLPHFSTIQPPSDNNPHNIYGGISVVKSDCIRTKCPSLKGDSVMRRFVLVSTDLLDSIVSSSFSLANMPRLQSPKEAPEVVVANLIHELSSSKVGPIQNISLKGLVSKTSQRGLVGDYLQVWDRYKDAITHYDAFEQTSAFPRILLGIFTMDSPSETQRRQVIRSTYLRYFRRSKKSPHRICSLQEYNAQLDPKQQPHQDPKDSSTTFYCQLVYTFVMGSNPNGPKELVDDSQIAALGGLTIPNPWHHLSNETDIVHLNIHENMKEGKSQTWLKYATLVNQHLQAPIDYIGKIDGDTLLYPHLFLNQVLQTLPHRAGEKPYDIRIYGGDYRIRPSTNTFNLGPVYMGGHFYFMSLDLAEYIVSPKCNRTALAVWSEDQSIGNFIHSHPLPIKRIRLTTSLFEHPLKRMDRMRTLWRKQTQGQDKKKKNKKNTTIATKE